MIANARNSCPALLLLALASVPFAAMATDEACAGVTQKCAKDKPYEKTIGGSVYSCYDCKQALCKDGGNGGISGTATSSVCTEKATTFQPISLDDQSRAGDTLAPKPTTSRRPGRAVAPRPAKFDEADALLGKRLLATSASQREQRDHRTESAQTTRDHRTQSDRTNTVIEIVEKPSKTQSSQRLQAPSDLAISKVSGTALTLSWHDNSTGEFGVEVYRADPVEGRRDPNNLWKLVGTFQERELDNVAGTGMRVHEDVDLSPGARYCYRMRAYSGFQRAQVSGFSDVACADTASTAASQTGGPRSRGTRPTNQAADQIAVSPEPATIAVPLTSAECKKLGGRVTPMFLCKSFGNAACITTDQAGTTHAVCISNAVEVSGAPSDDAPIVSPNNRIDLPAPDSNMAVAPLTSQECKGLGGTEISTNKCSALDQKTCATVDKHGVIRVACIDKVAN